MKKTKAFCAASIVVLACTGSLEAHHSGSMYDPTPLWVSGTVVSYDSINPHTITTLEERTADGQARRWAVEGPGEFQLDGRRVGDYLPNVGDVIGFCAFPYKSAEELSRIFPGADFSARRFSADTDASSPEFVWGHLMVTADGEKRLWNPHGILGECILSSDEPRQSWLDSLNSDPGLRQSWCQQRRYEHVQSSASLQELAEEISDQMDIPCE